MIGNGGSDVFFFASGDSTDDGEFDRINQFDAIGSVRDQINLKGVSGLDYVNVIDGAADDVILQLFRDRGAEGPDTSDTLLNTILVDANNMNSKAVLLSAASYGTGSQTVTTDSGVDVFFV